MRIKYLGIFSAASIFAIGLSLGTIPCVPYNRIDNRSTLQPRNAAHLSARNNDSFLLPDSTYETIAAEVPIPRASTPRLGYTRPSGPIKALEGKGTTPRKGVGTTTLLPAFSRVPFPLPKPRDFGRVEVRTPVLFFASLGLLVVLTATPYIRNGHESTTTVTVTEQLSYDLWNADTEVVMEWTERQREEAIRSIIALQMQLDKIATQIHKVEIHMLGEAVSASEKAAADFIKKIRTML